MKNKILQYITSDNYSKKTIDELSCSLNVEPLEFKDFVKAINELEEEGIIYITNKGYIHDSKKVNIYSIKIFLYFIYSKNSAFLFIYYHKSKKRAS